MRENYENWNKFVAAHSLGTIHQTSMWGDFQAKNKGRNKYFIVTLESLRASKPASVKSASVLVDRLPPSVRNHRPAPLPPSPIQAGGLFIRHRLPFGLSWLYCSRGPLCDYSKPAQLQALLKKLAPIAKRERAVFLRIDPPLHKSAPQKLPLGFRLAHAEYQPTHTLILDLSQTEEQILAQMKPKGRYNIKVAQKHGVKIRAANAKTLIKDLDNFYKILSSTGSRDGFHIHPKSYYKNMLDALSPQKMADLFIAKYRNKTIAGIIVVYFKNNYNSGNGTTVPLLYHRPPSTATYYFGASDYEYRNLMAPYLLQWEAIREARRRGFKFYDFLGIAPLNATCASVNPSGVPDSNQSAADSSGAPNPRHPYAKITDFKMKFGGHIHAYSQTKEFVFKPVWYLIMQAVKKLKIL